MENRKVVNFCCFFKSFGGSREVLGEKTSTSTVFTKEFQVQQCQANDPSGTLVNQGLKRRARGFWREENQNRWFLEAFKYPKTTGTWGVPVYRIGFRFFFEVVELGGFIRCFG